MGGYPYLPESNTTREDLRRQRRHFSYGLNELDLCTTILFIPPHLDTLFFFVALSLFLTESLNDDLEDGDDQEDTLIKGSDLVKIIGNFVRTWKLPT